MIAFLMECPRLRYICYHSWHMLSHISKSKSKMFAIAHKATFMPKGKVRRLVLQDRPVPRRLPILKQRMSYRLYSAFKHAYCVRFRPTTYTNALRHSSYQRNTHIHYLFIARAIVRKGSVTTIPRSTRYSGARLCGGGCPCVGAAPPNI